MDIHPTFVAGLQLLLSSDPELVPILTVSNPSYAVKVAAERLPDVVVMSLELGDVNGIALIAELRALPTPAAVITLTAESDLSSPVRALEAGAVGFLTKELAVEDVIAAIKISARGGTWIPAPLLGAVMKQLRASGPADQDDCAGMLSRLTSRELEVLRLMVSGLDRGAISTHLFRSPNTVRTHIGSIMAKMNAHSAVEVVAIALRAGMRPDTTHAYDSVTVLSS